MRKNLINAGLALILVPATVAMVLQRLPNPDLDVLAFRKPNHRVAMAVEEAMRAELASVVMGQWDFGFASLTPANVANFGFAGVTPAAAAKGQYPLPEGSNFFWDTMKAAPPAVLPAMGPQLVTLTNLDLTGKARDGREVHVTIQDDPFGQGCVVDCHGDEALARALAPRIADRLAHPLHKHDSPEDRAALTAFFNAAPPAANAPPGKLDPAVQRASGTADLDPEDQDQ